MSTELPVSSAGRGGAGQRHGRENDQDRVLDYPASARRVLRESPSVRDAVTRGTLRLDGHRRAAYAELDMERWRRWAQRVKDHLLSDLDGYLEQAESRLTAAGARVHWAETASDLHALLDDLVEDRAVRTVVKGKSMLSEELEVNSHLQARGVEVVETDLGEYVVQLGEEPPSHILAPAVHRSLGDIRELFGHHLGTDAAAGPEELTAAARSALREVFLAADMGITGGNFLVAETGTLALIENEGNIRLATSLPRIHVAVVGIEKLLPRASDLAPFLQLASRGATGQRLGTFVSLIHGPARQGEPDGPEELHVVLVDNGRSELLADDEAWETLRCIRCSACVNVCPVFRQTGGHAYDWMYSGPIGAVLAPGLLGLARAHSLPQASTLCGACFVACPVRIPIPELLLTWRRRAVDDPRVRGARARAGAIARALLHRSYATVMTSPRLYRFASALLRRIPGKLLESRLVPVLRDWCRVRARPEPSPRSFRELWHEELERAGARGTGE